MLPFFSFHPSKELPLSPPISTEGKQSQALLFPWKGAVTRAVTAGLPAGAALGCCQGLRRGCTPIAPAHTRPGMVRGRRQSREGTGRTTILPGVSSVQDDPWCANLLLETHHALCFFSSWPFKNHGEPFPNLRCLLVSLSGIETLTQDRLWCFGQVKGTIEIGATEGRQQPSSPFFLPLGVCTGSRVERCQHCVHKCKSQHIPE